MAVRHLFLDRFEGDLAVCAVSEKQFITVPRWLLPDGARPGQFLRVDLDEATGEGRSARFEIDRERTAAGREEAARLLNALTREDDGGDVTL